MAADLLKGRIIHMGAGRLSQEGSAGKAAAGILTPDPSGIPYYSDDMFIQTMRTAHIGHMQGADELAMPWRYYGRLNDDDLKGSVRLPPRAKARASPCGQFRAAHLLRVLWQDARRQHAQYLSSPPSYLFGERFE